ncbi:MAG: hypothetical protein ACK5WD_02925 [bacterium]|jgi:hypothetical protein
MPKTMINSSGHCQSESQDPAGSDVHQRMVDLPSTTLGTQVNGTERMTGRPINMIGGLAGQTFNGTQRKLLTTY